MNRLTRLIENQCVSAVTGRRDMVQALDQIKLYLEEAAATGKLFVKADHYAYPGRRVAEVGRAWAHDRGCGVYVYFFRTDGKTPSSRDRSMQITELEIRE